MPQDDEPIQIARGRLLRFLSRKTSSSNQASADKVKALVRTMLPVDTIVSGEEFCQRLRQLGDEWLVARWLGGHGMKYPLSDTDETKQNTAQKHDENTRECDAGE